MKTKAELVIYMLTKFCIFAFSLSLSAYGAGLWHLTWNVERADSSV